MNKYFIYLVTLSLLFSFSCKQIKKWTGKSSVSDEQVKVLIMQKQELEKRIKTDSANYTRELETLRMEYEQKLAQYEATKKKSPSGFSVIVGSFKNIYLAEKYSETVRSLGYDASLIAGPNNFNCVSTGTYSRLKDALPELARVRSGITQEAWIYFK